MRAIELVERIPTVTAATSALEAAAVIARYGLSGLIVADGSGVPIAVVPGSQVLKLVVPRYVREDPALAHAYDEAGAQELCAKLADHTIADLLTGDGVDRQDIPSVLPEDTLVEIATVMVVSHTPLVIVRGKNGDYHGAITFSKTMAAIAAAAGHENTSVTARLASTEIAPVHEA